MTAETIGPRLKELRLARGAQQKEFAARLGIAPSQLRQIESGYYVPSLQVLETILGELDAHLEIELDEEGGMATDSSRPYFPPAEAAIRVAPPTGRQAPPQR